MGQDRAVQRRCARVKLFAVAFASGLAALGCSATKCETLSQDALLVAVWHGSAGLAPVISSVMVDDRGQLYYVSPRGKRRCGTLETQELARLASLMNDTELVQAAKHAEQQGASQADVEEIVIAAQDWRAEIPTALLPSEVRTLLAALAASLHTHFDREAPWEEFP